MTMQAITMDDLRDEPAKTSESWRGRLLDPEKLAALAELLGFGWFTPDDIRGLWRIGLLRADLVSSESPIDVSGFIPVGSVAISDRRHYCDVRTIAYRPSGYGSSFGEANSDCTWDLGSPLPGIGSKHRLETPANFHGTVKTLRSGNCGWQRPRHVRRGTTVTTAARFTSGHAASLDRTS
jgi:hypothetical protein